MRKDILYPLRRLHGYLHDKNVNRKLRLRYKEIFKNNSKTVFLVMTPEHSNIGDHAIALAEKQLLNNIGISYIELTGRKLNEMKMAGQLNVMNGYPIIFNGGGYLGTLWFEDEITVREIISKNRNSRILFLPNTIFYEETSFGHTEFEKSKEIYNKHKHLYLCAREKKSYQIMKHTYKNVMLIPDMVLSMNPYNSNAVRRGCLLCLRHDHEKTRTDNEEAIIKDQAEFLFPGNVKYTDMIAPHDIPINDSEKAVYDKMDEFSSAELVITDRLHGMIFCAITGTPCIVVNSKSPKVLGCYEWIKHLEYIRFADDILNISKEFKQIPKKEYGYNNEQIKHYYEVLERFIFKYVCV